MLGFPIATYPIGAAPAALAAPKTINIVSASSSAQHAVSTTAAITITPRAAGTVNLAGSGSVQHSTTATATIIVTARSTGVVNLIASSVVQRATSSTGIVTRVAKIINLIAAACTQHSASATAAITRTPRTVLTMVGGITVNSTGQTSVTISWQAATGNVAGYEYDVDNAPSYTQIGNVLSVTIPGLTPATQHPIQVRAYDALGNKAIPLTTTITTNNSSPNNPSYTASAARTVGVQAASRSFTGGKFWDLSDPRKPRGIKDPDSTIDITFDWSDWLADIGNANIASATFILDGLDSSASYESNGKATVFVSGGVTGTATITCRISTDSTPVRIDDRTVYIDVEDE